MRYIWAALCALLRWLVTFKMRLRWIVIANLIAGLAECNPSAALSPSSSQALSQEGCRFLRFHLRDGFILVDGDIDRRTGVFMLDTGTPFPFLANRDYAHLPPGTEFARGSASSGQPVVIQTHRGVRSVRIASAYSFDDPETVYSGDFGFVAKEVGLRFLGFVGWGLLKDYTFAIDYRALQVTLCSHAVGVSPKAGVAAVLKVPAAKTPSPFTLTVAGVDIPTLIDTGSPGVVSLTSQTRSKLEQAGVLESQKGILDVSIRRASYGNYSFSIEHSRPNDGSEDLITLGYSFLRRYVSIWDPIAGTVTLVLQ
jgi:hypothetical protein